MFSTACFCWRAACSCLDGQTAANGQPCGKGMAACLGTPGPCFKSRPSHKPSSSDPACPARGRVNLFVDTAARRKYMLSYVVHFKRVHEHVTSRPPYVFVVSQYCSHDLSLPRYARRACRLHILDLHACGESLTAW